MGRFRQWGPRLPMVALARRTQRSRNHPRSWFSAVCLPAAVSFGSAAAVRRPAWLDRPLGYTHAIYDRRLGSAVFFDDRRSPHFFPTDFAIAFSKLVASKRWSAARSAAPCFPLFGVSTMLEQMQIAAGFVPVNLATAANNSDWINLKSYNRLLIVFFKAAAASGTEDPTVTVLQATDVAGYGCEGVEHQPILDQDRCRFDDDRPVHCRFAVHQHADGREFGAKSGHLGDRSPRRPISTKTAASTACKPTSRMSAPSRKSGACSMCWASHGKATRRC